jgi:regulator of sirC expression with transglutaminase-like and TPR domain
VDFKEAQRLDRSYAPSLRGLGLAYAQKGDKKAAISAFEKYLRAAPKAADAPVIRQKIADLKAR